MKQDLTMAIKQDLILGISQDMIQDLKNKIMMKLMIIKEKIKFRTKYNLIEF